MFDDLDLIPILSLIVPAVIAQIVGDALKAMLVQAWRFFAHWRRARVVDPLPLPDEFVRVREPSAVLFTMVLMEGTTFRNETEHQYRIHGTAKMKRDSKLITKILERLENDPQCNGDNAVRVEIPGYSREVVASHLRLMNGAGLIRVIDLSDHDEVDLIVREITMAGHDHLERSRRNPFDGPQIRR